MPRFTTRTLIGLVVALVLWASAFAGIRAGLRAYSPSHLAIFRFLIASLVLAIFTLPTCGVAGIAGLILGIVALVKISHSQHRLKGQGLAIAGICVSGFFLFLMPGIFLPALAKAKARAQRIQCVNQMKQIGLATRLWANDHGGAFPPDLLAISNELSKASVLVCPSDTKRNRDQYTDWSAVARYGSSYQYSGSRASETRPQEIILRCPIHNNAAMADGSVQQLRTPARTR